MKARRLYIIGDEYQKDTEVQNTCDGLFTKYRARSEFVWMVGYHPKVNVKTKENGLKSDGFDHEVGVYAVFHAMGAASDANKRFNPHYLVNTALKETLGGDFKKISRIVLLACNISFNKSLLKMAAGKTLQEVDAWGDGAGYLLLVMKNLAAAGVTPTVVGWDCFITALPHKPSGNSVYSDLENPSGTTVLQPQQIEARKGAKVVQGQSGPRAYGLVTPAYRAEHKRTFRIENGKVMILGSEGWSDT